MKQKSVYFFIVLAVLNTALFSQAPDWQWATQAGGSDYDRSFGITTDENGNSYITGYFSDTATFGSFNLTSYGSSDIFFAKIDANGNWLWANQAGGSEGDAGRGITTDENGNIYVSGTFNNTITFGPYNLTSNGGVDIFVAKIDSDGNCLWVTQAGGDDSTYYKGIATDENGYIYVTGEFHYTATFGPYTLNSDNGNYYVAKLDSNGNWLWVTQADGISYNNVGNNIATDENGNSYITGYFYGIATFGSHTLIHDENGTDIFIAKLDSDGNWLWAIQAGGNTSHNRGYGITADENGNCYITGYFDGIVTFGSHTLIHDEWGGSEIFVAKLDTNGNWLWATQAEVISHNNHVNKGYSIEIDDFANSYITGEFSNTTIFGSYTLNSDNGNHFVAKLDLSGNWLWALQFDGTSEITTVENGNCFLTGFFYETASFGSNYLTSSGEWDVFVAKLGNDTSVENEIIPTKTELSNYPNPFNPSTTISFSINEESTIELSIYNIKGQFVKQLVSDQLSVGEHSVVWDGKADNGKSVSSGIYFYKLKTSNYEKTKRMVLLK